MDKGYLPSTSTKSLRETDPIVMGYNSQCKYLEGIIGGTNQQIYFSNVYFEITSDRGDAASQAEYLGSLYPASPDGNILHIPIHPQNQGLPRFVVSCSCQLAWVRASWTASEVYWGAFVGAFVDMIGMRVSGKKRAGICPWCEPVAGHYAVGWGLNGI